MDMMKAVVTTGTGGLDKLVYKSVPVPVPGEGEVLIRVLAAGVNNTEINTRLGWYSSSITDGDRDRFRYGGQSGCRSGRRLECRDALSLYTRNRLLRPCRFPRTRRR
jgi:hypothetical protein